MALAFPAISISFIVIRGQGDFAKGRALLRSCVQTQGILEEVQLIEWPAPAQALTDTTLVIGIVAFTATVLFGVNTVLADLSKILYK